MSPRTKKTIEVSQETHEELEELKEELGEKIDPSYLNPRFSFDDVLKYLINKEEEIKNVR